MDWSNETEPLPQCKDHDKMHHLQLAWHGAVLALGLPLNVISLWFFLRVLRLRSVVTIYMTNLAVCDLLFTLALPLRLYYYANHLWNLGDVPCQLAGSLFQLNMYGSCLFLAAINVDRFLALAHPLRSRPFRRPWLAWKVCGAVWALIVLGSVPVALAHDTSRCLGANSSQVEVRCFESFSGVAWKKKLLPLVVLAETLGFLLPLSAVLYCSARILGALAGTGTGEQGERAGGSRRRRKKTILLLLANALIFVACFVPYNLALGVYALSRSELAPLAPHSQKQLRQALQLTVLLSGTNCCLDPLVYYYTTEGFRATMRAGASAWSGGKSGLLKGKGDRGEGTHGAGRGRWEGLAESGV